MTKIKLVPVVRTQNQNFDFLINNAFARDPLCLTLPIIPLKIRKSNAHEELTATESAWSF